MKKSGQVGHVLSGLCDMAAPVGLAG